MATMCKPCAIGFACLICGRSIKERHNMRTHMRNQHMKPPKYKCPPCNQIFQKYIAFYHHVRRSHPEWQGIDYASFRVDWEWVKIDFFVLFFHWLPSSFRCAWWGPGDSDVNQSEAMQLWLCLPFMWHQHQREEKYEISHACSAYEASSIPMWPVQSDFPQQSIPNAYC